MPIKLICHQISQYTSTDNIPKGGVSPGFTLYQEFHCTLLNVDSLYILSNLNRGKETSDPTDHSKFNLPVKSKEKEWLWDVGPVDYPKKVDGFVKWDLHSIVLT